MAWRADMTPCTGVQVPGGPHDASSGAPIAETLLKLVAALRSVAPAASRSASTGTSVTSTQYLCTSTACLLTPLHSPCTNKTWESLH